MYHVTPGVRAVILAKALELHGGRLYGLVCQKPDPRSAVIHLILTSPADGLLGAMADLVRGIAARSFHEVSIRVLHTGHTLADCPDYGEIWHDGVFSVLGDGRPPGVLWPVVAGPAGGPSGPLNRLSYPADPYPDYTHGGCGRPAAHTANPLVREAIVGKALELYGGELGCVLCVNSAQDNPGVHLAVRSPDYFEDRAVEMMSLATDISRRSFCLANLSVSFAESVGPDYPGPGDVWYGEA